MTNKKLSVVAVLLLGLLSLRPSIIGVSQTPIDKAPIVVENKILTKTLDKGRDSLVDKVDETKKLVDKLPEKERIVYKYKTRVVIRYDTLYVSVPDSSHVPDYNFYTPDPEPIIQHDTIYKTDTVIKRVALIYINRKNKKQKK